MNPATMMAAASTAQKLTSSGDPTPAGAQMPTLNASSTSNSRSDSGDISSDFRSGSFSVGGSSSNWVYMAIIAGVVIIAAIYLFKGKR